MTVHRRSPVPLFVVCFALLCHAALGAGEQPPGADPPREIAKAPTQESVPPPGAQEAAPSAAQGSAAGSVEAAPAPPGQEVVMLGGSPPAPLTAAEYLDLGLDFAFYNDAEGARAWLEQAAAADPGSDEAVRALALLASEALRAGDQARADALFAQAWQEAGDPERQAFVELSLAYAQGMQQGDLAGVQELLTEAADAHRGTFTGGWSLLALGELHRSFRADFAAAAQAFQSLLDEYQTGECAEEAAVCLAECTDWSHDDRFAAIALYETALEKATHPRLRLRALVGLGDCVREVGGNRRAHQFLSEIIDAYAGRPAANLARAFRSAVNEQLGNREQAAADARAYLASGNLQHAWRAHSHHLLGKYAFQEGRIEEAEAEFQAAAAVADAMRHPDRYAGSARAGIASCRQARGDPQGALAYLTAAADRATDPGDAALYLYRAAGVAQQIGDPTAATEIIDRMVRELPGSHLTARLAGRQVLPVPGV